MDHFAIQAWIVENKKLRKLQPSFGKFVNRKKKERLLLLYYVENNRDHLKKSHPQGS